MTRYSIFLLPAMVGIVLLLGCTSKETDPEAEIRQFLESGEAAIEAREMVSVANMISEQYGDPSGRSRRDLVRTVAAYVLRNESIHVVTRIDAIEIIEDGRANARVFAAMVGKSMGGSDPLTDLRADLYRFDLALAKESGDWKLARAEWRRAEQQDLLQQIIR